MSEESQEVKTRKPKPAKKDPKTDYMIDWKAAAEEIEAALRGRGWDAAHQRKNPQFVQGLVTHVIVRPLVTAINKK